MWLVHSVGIYCCSGLSERVFGGKKIDASRYGNDRDWKILGRLCQDIHTIRLWLLRFSDLLLARRTAVLLQRPIILRVLLKLLLLFFFQQLMRTPGWTLWAANSIA